MKNKIILAAAVLLLSISSAFGQTTEFTYQGRLLDGSLPATGNYDLEFRLFDAEIGGSDLGVQARPGVPVANGIFTVRLDFGTQFNGDPRWLAISIRQVGEPTFINLTPRQPLTSSPYAIRSLNSFNADLAANSIQLGGIGSGEYVITSDPRMTDARAPLPGSAEYIQNTATQQPLSDFNISGTGTANILNAGTQFNINGVRVLGVDGSQNVVVGQNSGTNNTGFGNAFFGHFSGNANTTGANNSFFGTDSGRNNNGTGNSFFGRSSGFDNTTGESNSFFGLDAGRFNATGNSNSFFGRNAGRNSATGNSNAFFGVQAGDSNVSGFANTVLGTNADVGAPDLQFATAIGANASVTSSNTIVLGRSGGEDSVVIPGDLNTSGAFSANVLNTATRYNLGGQHVLSAPGSDNLFVGLGSGSSNTSGHNNSFLGNLAGTANTSGIRNTFIGSGAGQSNTEGTGNVFIGTVAGFSNTTANLNTFVGSEAGFSNLLGSSNAFFGHRAGRSNVNGVGNSFFGYYAGQSNLSFFNSYFGTLSGQANTDGNNNAFFGYVSGNQNSTGSFNSFFGSFAGEQNTTGTWNSFFGYSAGRNNTASGNAFFGHLSGSANTSASGNSFFGYQSGMQNTSGAENSIFGSGSGQQNQTGSRNTYFGWRTGFASISANDNSFFGHSSGISNTGIQNSFFGSGAGDSNTSGSNNSFFGRGAGSANTTGVFNTFVGTFAGDTNTTGGSNTIIGNSADVGSGSLTFATAIGAGAVATSSNQIVLGRAAEAVYIPGRLYVDGDLGVLTLGAAGTTQLCRNSIDRIATCSSSLRYKTNINPFFGGLDVVRRLRPITYSWIDGKMPDIGFAAEDVAAIEPLLATYHNGQIEGVKYAQITTVLVNAVNEQQAQIEQQKKQIEEQEKKNQDLTERLRELEKRVEILIRLACKSDPKAPQCD